MSIADDKAGSGYLQDFLNNPFGGVSAPEIGLSPMLPGDTGVTADNNPFGSVSATDTTLTQTPAVDPAAAAAVAQEENTATMELPMAEMAAARGLGEGLSAADMALLAEKPEDIIRRGQKTDLDVLEKKIEQLAEAETAQEMKEVGGAIAAETAGQAEKNGFARGAAIASGAALEAFLQLTDRAKEQVGKIIDVAEAMEITGGHEFSRTQMPDHGVRAAAKQVARGEGQGQVMQRSQASSTG